METTNDLARSLVQWAALGKLDAGVILPALQELSGGSFAPPPLVELLEFTASSKEAELGTLTQHLRDACQREVLAFRRRRVEGRPQPSDATQALAGLPLEAPLQWQAEGALEAALNSAETAVQDLLFAQSHSEAAPETAEIVGRNLLDQAKGLVRHLNAHGGILKAQLLEAAQTSVAGAWPAEAVRALKADLQQFELAAQARAKKAVASPVIPLPEDVDRALALAAWNERWAQGPSEREQRALLDLLCCWPTVEGPHSLALRAQPGWMLERAALVLALRFGIPSFSSWWDWENWLAGQEEVWRRREEATAARINSRAATVLWLWHLNSPAQDPAALALLEAGAREEVGPSSEREFLQRWSQAIPPSERTNFGLPLETLAEPTLAPPVIPAFEPRRRAPVDTKRPAVPPPLPVTARAAAIEETPAETPPHPPAPAPPSPSLWSEHIQPFFVENWYFLAGIAMVLVGSSLVAFYTWDKHWLVRYTIMPALLAFFTWELARVGQWVERRDVQFKATAAILRGAAIGLLPVNFMAVAVLSGDSQVSHKGPAMLAMALVYAGFFGWGLRRWCAAEHPALGNVLGGILLLLNALLALGPLARTLARLEGEALWRLMGAGFYAGFFLLAGAVIWFAGRVLTRELVEEKRVPWFVGGTLALTYLQVFAWAHSWMHVVPRVHTYAPGLILAGALVLFVERVSLQLAQAPQGHRGESFLGFALVMLGLLMGNAHDEIRILSFLLAGAVWLRQAFLAEHPLHYWIGLTLVVLGSASVTLLPSFPGPWRPAVGLALAVAMMIGQHFGSRRGWTEFAQACHGMQAALLMLTTIVAVLTQWHYRSAPWLTALGLLVIAALLIWRALRDDELRWLHTAMLVLAVTLPYLGFMDMHQHTVRDNTMVAGLALLSLVWLGANALRPIPLLRQARSTVLWFYGALALVAMLIRVYLGEAAPNPAWFRDALDYLGPILMTVAMVFATYYSRSLVPAGIAVAILAILFPEMRANLERTFTGSSWGTGLGSASSALGLMILCFFLRRWPALQQLGEGDHFLGREQFPLRRHDHTLFTAPILVAVLYLGIKVDAWNFARNWSGDGLALKTAVALVMTAVVWTLASVYQRQDRRTSWLVWLGYFWGAVGMGCGYWRLADNPHWSWPFLLVGLTVQSLYWFYRYGLEPRWSWARTLLTDSAFLLLHYGSLILLVLGSVALGFGADWDRLKWLLVFLAAQGFWHGLARREMAFGVALFFLLSVFLLALTAPGTTPLWERVSVARSLPPTLWMLLAVQALVLLMEKPKAWFELAEPVVRPAFALASLAAAGLGVWVCVDLPAAMKVPPAQQGLLLAALLLTARAHRAAHLLLLAFFLSYGLVQLAQLRSLSQIDERLLLLATPWRVAVFALAMVLLLQAGRYLHGRWPWLFEGPYVERWFTAPSAAWVYRVAVALACLAAVYYTVRPDYRQSAVQLWTPYLGAAAGAAVAWFWQRSRYWGVASGLVVLANLHLVRVFAGEWLRGHGLSELHLACLGFGLTLGMTSLLRWKLSQRVAVSALNQGSLALAGMILALLSANYLSQPNLEAMTAWRYVISGALALLAGWYFRRAARNPAPGEEQHVALAEACYHFGIVLAIWCAALLIPALRRPTLALTALSLPMVFFYVRAETGARSGNAAAPRYRNSAAVLGFVIMALYVFRGVFQMVAFPDQPIATDHYHHHAGLLMGLSLVLLRLHGLGGTSWLAWYGGLGLMTGSYFLLTALPKLSPFEQPIPAAWCAIGLGHFWIAVSHNRSPLRTAMQRLAGLDDAAWHELRHSWGLALLIAIHGAVLWGLTDWEKLPRLVAPLVVGAASIVIHQGIIRQSRIYLALAGVELLVALHVDFLVPSWLDRSQILWVLLGLWAAFRVVRELKGEWLTSETLGVIASCLGTLVFTHILYHRPDAGAGLWGMALLALLAASHPLAKCPSEAGGERLAAWLLLGIPTWLAYFSQAPLRERGMEGALATWPLLATLTTIFLTGVAASLHQARWAARGHAWPRARFFLLDQLLDGLERYGERIHFGTLWLGFAGALAIQAFHYQSPFALREWVLLTALYGAMSFAWFVRCQRKPSLTASYLMQFCAVGAFAVIRRQLMLSTAFWNYEYDVWTSLVVAFLLTGAQRAFGQQSRPLQVSLLTSLCALPAIGLVWVIVHGLGANLALMVVGLHSVMFAYLGRDDRESPFHLVAIGGFVLFVLLTFWTKLHLRAVHAYVIPVGLGVLVLLHLLRARIKPQTRSVVRLLTLLAMLGSAGYYALLDPRYPVTFNLVLILLCLFAMGLGSLLKVRLYLALGFAGLIVALISLLAKMLIHADRSLRMTAIGSLVLGLGAALVFGAIYYKTNREKIDARFHRWRERFGGWE